jgi:heptosyltransferase-2
MVERFAALAFANTAGLPAQLPWPELSVDQANQQRLQAELGIAADRPLLGICPGAEFGPAKQWPARHYAALAQQYIERGWQVVALGSANDSAAAAAIREGLAAAGRDEYIDACGVTSLVDAVDLLALCRAVVSNDSGLMHVAAAVGRPLVAVYGSTSPGFTPPLGRQVQVAAIDLPCRPCFQRECPLGHLNCLVQLQPQQVTSALDTLLSTNGA